MLVSMNTGNQTTNVLLGVCALLLLVIAGCLVALVLHQAPLPTYQVASPPSGPI